GGTHNGSNLFHSFDEFNVKTNQTANFLTTPDTRNILGRVTGANASIINGLIQVIGSNSNLFLMNPAGIMFGPNARLHIPASFSVTTATGIGFNNNNFWFKAMETNDYSKLIGNPSGYRFNSEQLGQIVNQGNLSLNPGENLTLLGGTVVNTGQLSSPGGKITIAAVEDSGMVRISQPGHLLSLEFDPNKVNEKDTSNLGSGFLAYVLTGGDQEHATSIRVDADGNLMLTNKASIDVSSSDHTGEQVHVLEDNVTIAHGSIDVSSSDNIGGEVHVLGDRVSLVDANINADGSNGGGKVFIGGNLQSHGIVPNFQETFINQNSFISKVNADGNVMLKDHVTITNTSIDVSSSDNIGGQVDVLGDRVSLMDTNINADGLNGGGKVFIGGDLQSHGIVPNFQETFINQNSLISRVNADGNVMLKDHVTITNTSIDVSSSNNIGGQVDVLGDQVSLMDTNINADGLNGGGTVLIGGDFQGHGIGIVPNSQETFINQNSFISADAIRNGDGGQVNIWSDGITNFEGNISAKGGENSGDGGFVEVSGKQKLNFNAKVNVSAEFGNIGTILLDP
ncbi:MAG: filamentous hemagglutinin N-terminal domain-containing protein, partial [Trichodesmium sp. St16_bin2-tuft]|nr:filamentous hemagglutinin N-terminal domain-containing protein [Trichodesmium sp. St16_bin2-tuft]